jgi:shikimate dehydrogenase
MKKFLVLGNPIEHSKSPQLHNYWIKQHNIDAEYSKRLIIEKDIKETIKELRDDKISGANITIPFKNYIIPFVDELTETSKKVQSINTIYKIGKKIIGDNTDVTGFKKSLQHINYNPKDKKALILGAGGVVSSIIFSLQEMGASEIFLSNRTREKAENLKDLKIVNWGETTNFDIIINATSLGLKDSDSIKIDYENHKSKLFYDIIYNPTQTKFLKLGESNGNQTENGRLMFVYQAQLAFEIWHGIKPKIDNEVLRLIS